MRIILEPKVTVISVPQFVEHSEYQIPDDGDDALKIGAFAAKGCYDSYSKTGRPNEENQSNILEHRHGSVTEHIHIGVFIEGITRSLSLELNRHRTFNISQRSTRYTAEEDGAIVLSPFYSNLWKKYKFYINEKEMPVIKALDADPFNYKEIILVKNHITSSMKSFESYQKQVDDLIKLNPNKLSGFDLRKWARGNARNVLPHNLETRGTWTNNVRGWRWFIELRSDKHAEPEIRLLADKCLTELRKVAPFYFEDFEIVETVENIPVWKPKYSKV